MTAIPMHNLAGFSDPHAAVEELMRRDFGSFLIRAMPHIQGGAALDYNWHIDAIAYQLERVSKGSCRRLIVNLPPRNLKSIMISVAWVAWRLGNDPMLNFVCVSYSNELSAKHARDCRSIMQSRWYHDLFPGTRINGSRSAAHDFETTAGGGRLATSIGGTLTGRGGDIIIDDPIKPDDANSDTARDAVNEWFHSTLASRLNDKKRGAIVTVMQRLHQYDLCGMLIETGDWDVLTLPSIAVEDEIIPLTRGRVHARKTGDILHPSREPYAALMAVKQGVGSINFEAQYQQNPVPAEGNMIRAEWLRVYDHLPCRNDPRCWRPADVAIVHGQTGTALSLLCVEHQQGYRPRDTDPQSPAANADRGASNRDGRARCRPYAAAGRRCDRPSRQHRLRHAHPPAHRDGRGACPTGWTASLARRPYPVRATAPVDCRASGPR